MFFATWQIYIKDIKNKLQVARKAQVETLWLMKVYGLTQYRRLTYTNRNSTRTNNIRLIIGLNKRTVLIERDISLADISLAQIQYLAFTLVVKLK